MSTGSWKGSDFEREICKRLSLWWTGGERDDVFWRSSQSGGRATQRAKSGRTTYGSYGDIAAIDPIGEPLLKFATIELKRGSSHGVPWDLFEGLDSKAVRIFEGALLQANRSAEQAGSKGWFLLGRRDRKKEILYLDWRLYKLLKKRYASYVIFHIPVNRKGDKAIRVKFIAVEFHEWLSSTTPAEIIECLR